MLHEKIFHHKSLIYFGCKFANCNGNRWGRVCQRTLSSKFLWGVVATPVPITVTPVPNAARVPAPVLNATSAGNNKWPIALCDVINTVASQSADNHQQKKKRTGRKNRNEKQAYEDLVKYTAINFSMDTQCRTLFNFGWYIYQEARQEEMVV